MSTHSQTIVFLGVPLSLVVKEHLLTYTHRDLVCNQNSNTGKYCNNCGNPTHQEDIISERKSYGLKRKDFNTLLFQTEEEVFSYFKNLYASSKPFNDLEVENLDLNTLSPTLESFYIGITISKLGFDPSLLSERNKKRSQYELKDVEQAKVKTIINLGLAPKLIIAHVIR